MNRFEKIGILSYGLSLYFAIVTGKGLFFVFVVLSGYVLWQGEGIEKIYLALERKP